MPSHHHTGGATEILSGLWLRASPPGCVRQSGWTRNRKEQEAAEDLKEHELESKSYRLLAVCPLTHQATSLCLVFTIRLEMMITQRADITCQAAGGTWEFVHSLGSHSHFFPEEREARRLEPHPSISAPCHPVLSGAPGSVSDILLVPWLAAASSTLIPAPDSARTPV